MVRCLLDLWSNRLFRSYMCRTFIRPLRHSLFELLLCDIKLIHRDSSYISYSQPVNHNIIYKINSKTLLILIDFLCIFLLVKFHNFKVYDD